MEERDQIRADLCAGYAQDTRRIRAEYVQNKRRAEHDTSVHSTFCAVDLFYDIISTVVVVVDLYYDIISTVVVVVVVIVVTGAGL